MSKEIEYWEGRGRWLDSRSEAHDATCDQCGRVAVLVTLDGEPVRAYHPYTVDLVSEPCPALLPMLGVEGAPLSSYVLPENVTVRPAHERTVAAGIAARGPVDRSWVRQVPVDQREDLPLHRTEANSGVACSTCDGGGCPDCTDPAG